MRAIDTQPQTQNGSDGSGQTRAASSRDGLRYPAYRIAGTVILLLAATAWLVTLLIESGDEQASFSQAARALLAGRDEAASDVLLELDTGEPETERLVGGDLVPVLLDGWVVQGPQSVPGSAGAEVETFYNPADDERKIDTPLMVYVRVSKAESVQSAADQPVRRADERYAAGRAASVIDGVAVEVGHTEDFRFYYIGWAQDDLVYTVEAAYTHFVPQVRAREILVPAAEEIAGAVIGLSAGGGR